MSQLKKRAHAALEAATANDATVTSSNNSTNQSKRTATTPTAPVISMNAMNAVFETTINAVRLLTSTSSTTTVTTTNEPTNSDPETAVALLLQLCDIQRRLTDGLAQQELKLAALAARRRQRHRQTLATAYERDQLLRQQATLRQEQIQAIPHLTQLAKQEAVASVAATGAHSSNSSKSVTTAAANVNDENNNSDNEKSSTETTIGTTTTPTAVLDLLSSFLGVNATDPRNRAAIVSKLQQGFQKRASLELELLRKRAALMQTQQALKQKRGFLKSFPAHIAALERASQGMVKLFSKSISNNNKSIPGGGSVVAVGEGFQAMSDPERRLRLERAQQLPAPLYTLYSLLQNAMDESMATAAAAAVSTQQQHSEKESLPLVSASNETNLPLLNSDEMKLSVVHTSSSLSSSTLGGMPSSADSVVWQLAVAEVGVSCSQQFNAGYNSKYISIHFVYTASPVPTILVHTTGLPTLLNQEFLLEELFPGDVALNLPNNIGSTGSGTPGTRGQSYQWSNHLAGLYPVPMTLNPNATSNRAVTSTRVIIRQLQRRIRANATLKHILYSLQRLHVPPLVVDASSNRDKLVSKLVNFAADSTENGGNPFRQYSLEVKNLSSASSLYATVTIHMICYPSVPPEWKFYREKVTSTTTAASPLYDNRLEELARVINATMLDRLSVTSFEDGGDSATNSTIYEWVFIHQLREVMHFWDQAGVSAPTETEQGVGGHWTALNRQHRGRDRRSLH